MASPIFRVNNPGGALVVNRDGLGLNFLGRATYVSTTQATGSAGTLAGRENGYSTFTFTSSALIVPVVELKSGCVVRMLTCLRSGSTWTIKVYCGNSTLDSFGFATQEACEVYIFGRFTSAGGIGMKLRDNSGVLTHVFTDSDGPPLWVRSRVTEAGGSIDTSTVRGIPSLAKPAAVGWPAHDEYQSQKISASSYRNHEWLYGWKWNAAAPSGLLLAQAKRAQFSDSGPFGTTKIRASETLIINASAL